MTEEEMIIKKTKTDDELKKIAADLYDGKIFSDLNFGSPEERNRMAAFVFMPLALGVLVKMSKKEIADIGMVFEYLEKAGPRSINGYPVFFSCSFLTKSEAVRMFVFYDEYKKLKESFLGERKSEEKVDTNG